MKGLSATKWIGFILGDISHELSLRLPKEVVTDGKDLGLEDKACVNIY